jgi:four helix bundle protein
MPFRFEGLAIWQEARQFSQSIFQTAITFPDYEKFGLSNQLMRAANSISLNIAEGAGRATKADFANFLSIANGSTFEVTSGLFLASDRGYIQKATFDTLYGQADHLGKSINNFRRSLLAKR